MAKTKTNKKTKEQIKKDQRLTQIIVNLFLFALLVIAVFKLGVVGIFLNRSMRYIFGEYYLVMFVIFMLMTLIKIVKPKMIKFTKTEILGLSILFITFLLTTSIFNNYDLEGMETWSYFLVNSKAIFNTELSASGGFFGVILFSFSNTLFDLYGTYILTTILGLVGILLTFKNKLLNFKLPERKERKPKVKKEKKKKDKEIIPVIDKMSPYESLEVEEIKGQHKSNLFISIADEPLLKKEEKVVQTKLDVSEAVVRDPYVVGGKNYELPKLNLLDTKVSSRTSSKNTEAAKTKGEHLIHVLNEFNIESELVDIHIGPSVTKFEIRPDSSVKVSRINSIADNIKMELAARSIRIEAPIPGKNTVGIEIPNIENTPVKLYELLKDLPASESPLTFTLGKDLMGKVILSDLAKMPHLLVAGATGAGKSVALNAIITTILLRTTPEQVRLLLIDPKKVEFNSFAQAPHLMCDIINEPTQANTALMKVVEIMDDRYRKFAEINVKNIKAYNEYRRVNPEAKLENLELLVVIIDELADLMIVAGKEVEQSIQRITQLARAAGIHLIVATQRPSTDVITGIIKSNIPSRISFAVSSGIDSRTILDTVGAEKLLGNGDMLYYPVGYSAPVRCQGVYVSDEEVVRVATFAAKQPSPDHFDEFLYTEDDISNNYGTNYSNPQDALYEDVKAFVILERKASTSLIQRAFGIGYNRAARITDMLESNGVIGPQQGSKPREVLIQSDETDDYEELDF